MTGSNETNSGIGGQPWLEMWQKFYESNMNNWTGMMMNMGSSQTYGAFWNQYVQATLEMQEAFKQFNERWLQSVGLPTREDLSRVNQQIYDLANRLDELEEKLK